MVELVLGMLPLTLMFGLLLWISQFAWQLPAHTCKIRNAAWAERYSEVLAESNGFDFQSGAGIEIEESARVTGIGPAFERFPDISARNFVLFGSWDHRQFKLDRPPHWELARELAIKSQPEKLRGLGKLLPPSLGSFTSNLREQVFMASGPLQQAKELIDSLTGLLPGISDTQSQAEAAERAEAERQRREFAANREKLAAELQVARQNLSDHEQLIRQTEKELQAEQQKLAKAEEQELKEEIQKRIDRLEDEVLPSLQEERVKLARVAEESAAALSEFDSLEPPPVD